MAGNIRSRWLLWTALAMLIAVVVYAWIDGGREPLHEISQPVAVPGARP